MGGVSQLRLTGHTVIVEHRSAKYFVVYPDLRKELVMAFDSKDAALEIALNTYLGTPFFTQIPQVEYMTPYPRPWLTYPRNEDDVVILVRD